MIKKESTPEDIREAMEYLIQTVSKHKGAVIVGYVFSADPTWITSMSNVLPGQFNGTLTMIHDIAKVKETQGLVVKNVIKAAV